MSLFELCGWALCPSFVPLLRKRKKARESKRKQEKERKLQEKGRSERQVELDTCSVRGKGVCDVEFEFAVARRVHLIQVCLDPSSFPIELQENFL